MHVCKKLFTNSVPKDCNQKSGINFHSRCSLAHENAWMTNVKTRLLSKFAMTPIVLKHPAFYKQVIRSRGGSISLRGVTSQSVLNKVLSLAHPFSSHSAELCRYPQWSQCRTKRPRMRTSDSGAVTRLHECTAGCRWQKRTCSVQSRCSTCRGNRWFVFRDTTILWII